MQFIQRVNCILLFWVKIIPTQYHLKIKKGLIFIFSFWLELAVIVICLAIGGRFSGIGLGVAGGFGLAILTLGFGLPVGEMPTSVVYSSL